MSRFVSKAQLARDGKCSPQLISKKCAEGGAFFDAMEESGKIDVDHENVIKWLVARELVIHPNDLTTSVFEKMTVREINQHYGNVDKLEGYIKTNKLIVETEHKKMMMQASREELVSREFLAKACFGIIDTAMVKLMDMPRGMVERVAAILETDQPGVKEESEQLMTDEISKILKSAKREVIGQLGEYVEKEIQNEINFENTD